MQVTTSDYGIISLVLKITETQKRGEGFWKSNNSLLTDILKW